MDREEYYTKKIMDFIYGNTVRWQTMIKWKDESKDTYYFLLRMGTFFGVSMAVWILGIIYLICIYG